MSVLRIAPDLSLPLDAITQTTGILGIRGSGKSHTASVFAEELLAAGQQVIIVDPTDAWWGLRSSKDGKSVGFPITILGGNHCDLPLESTAGAVIADFAVDQRLSVILSLRHMSKGEQRRLMVDFCSRLWKRKAEPQHKLPLNFIVDEASLFVPQRVDGADAEMVGIIQRIVRQGRNSGFGVTLIDQRSATVNKDVLSQVELLICHRTIGKQDRDALKDWVEAHDTAGRGKVFLESLASLETGEAWAWSPGWLDIFRRIKVRDRRTFDSSATPKIGRAVAAPKEVAKVDLDVLRSKMAETIERVKAEDPRELRKRIVELERAARAALQPEALRQAEERAAGALRELDAMADKWRRAGGLIEQAMGLMGSVTVSTFSNIKIPTATTSPAPMPAARPAPRVANTNGFLAGPEQRIVDAVAWMESIGVTAPEQTAVAFLAGYTFGGGAFNNPRGSLRVKGYIEYAGDSLTLTDKGRAVANYPDAALDARELQRRVLERLPGPERRILEVILQVYPKSIGNDDCARAAGYTPGGGAFNNPRGRLRSLGLIDYPERGAVKAKALLFLEGRQ